MTIRAAVYENGDHTCLIWFPGDLQPIPGCRGFAIQRRLTKADGTALTSFLPNFVGFTDGAPKPAAGFEWQWPIQRFLWWDYAVSPGDTVSYQVIPVTGPAGQLVLQTADASAVSAPLFITGQVDAHMAAYFNKGIIAAQWVARELAVEAKSQASKTSTMTSVINTINDPLRNALGGLLRVQILAALDEVATNGGSIYAALYELNDPELIGRFKTLGAKVNLILANGAFKPPAKDEPANAKTRAYLKSLKTVKVYDRMVSSGHFAHNKFIVFCDPQGEPVRVLTGSTNWTVTGLCTQANNGFFINDSAVAKCFRDEWDLLKASANAFPPDLIAHNSEQKSFVVDNANVTVWFAPTSQQQDMQQARTLIENATQGALFLFFNPGHFADAEDQQTLLQTIIDRGRPGTPHFDGSLYIRGVVNQKIAGLTDDSDPAASSAAAKVGKKTPNTLPSPDEHDSSNDPQASHTPVLLYSDATPTPTRAPKDVLVPAAIKTQFHGWEAELLSMGVMVHSKVVVLDPFGAHPVLMTGSHNLGTKASRANDDNLVIIEGPGARALAIAYAVNIIAIYQEYRWRTYVAAHQADATAWHGLDDNDAWQAGHLQGGEAAELQFWAGGTAVAVQANQAKVAAAAASPAVSPPHAAPPTTAKRKGKRVAKMPKKKTAQKRAAQKRRKQAARSRSS